MFKTGAHVPEQPTCRPDKALVWGA